MFAAMKKSWSIHSLPISLLRLWLGVTWLYAGWYKATDPEFLTPNTSGYIGTQLANYQINSPISFLLRHMVERAGLVGLFVMLSEFAIGLATLTGFMLTYAVLGGLFMSGTLWLAASWSVKPYFLGSDSAYTVMWAVLLGSIFVRAGRLKFPHFSERREVMNLGVIAGLSIVLTLIGKAFTRSATSTSSSSHSSGSTGKKPIAKVSSLGIGKALRIQDANGAPAFLFRTTSGVIAYSAICTHQGCTVNFASASGHFLCPCHGAEFDPQSDAKVLAGPTRTPLAKIKLDIQGDEIYLA